MTRTVRPASILLRLSRPDDESHDTVKTAARYLLPLLLSVILTVRVNAQYSVSRNEALMTLWGENVSAGGYGVAMLIRMADGAEYRVAAGLSNLAAGTRLRVEDRFRIGSLTKTFTAVLTLKLVEQNLLRLEDPLTRWLPEDITAHLPNSARITIRHLLTHTSGLFNYVRNPEYRRTVQRQPDYPWTALETLRFAFDREPDFAPGEGWQYSNTNYNLLQVILETATGTPIHRLMQRQIFDYLHLQNTRWETAETIGQGIITGYGDYNRDEVLEDRTFYNDGIGLAGFAGIISTTDDLAAFLQALFHGRLLSPRMLNEMLKGVVTTEADHILYGMGVYLNDDALGLRVGHTGRTSGFSAQMWYLPEQQISVVIFTNNFHTPVRLLNTLVIQALAIVTGNNV